MGRNLTQFELQALKPKSVNYKKTDGGGLFLEILTTGTMVWRYQYLLGGKREKVTIGTYRYCGSAKDRIIIGLEAARDAHNEFRKLVKAGISPAGRTREEKLRSKLIQSDADRFQALVERWFNYDVQNKSQSWQYTVRNWLNKDILPELGHMVVATISEADVRRVIDSVARRGALASAEKIRSISRQIFAFARRNREIAANPAAEIEAVRRNRPQSHRALRISEIGPFLNQLDSDGGLLTNKLAIRLLALTLVRKDELRLAKWSEIDWEYRIWQIPAHRTKMRSTHEVHLSNQSHSILLRLKDFSDSSEFIFPSHSTKAKPIGHTTLNSVIDRLAISGGRFVPHGLRATASTVLNESGHFRPDVIERALAHQHRNRVRAIYNQAEYVLERAAMLQWWADYLDVLQSGVMVPPSLYSNT
jgi:integrase